jgi:DNA-binding response OmpR family regulator
MAVHPDNAGPFFYVLREAVRILFVDDDPILREFAVVNLASEHAVVDTAKDGVAALEAIEANTPDIVLLDLEMPTLDGFGVLQALRADARWRDLPVIVVTGREDVDAVDRAFGAGATSFVVKPLNWRLLSHQLRYVHRMATNERLLAESREATATQLMRLASHGAHFIAQALARDPSLRPQAVRFAQAADAALKRDETAEPAVTDGPAADEPAATAADKGWEAGGHHVPEAAATNDAPDPDDSDIDIPGSDETVRAA